MTEILRYLNRIIPNNRSFGIVFIWFIALIQLQFNDCFIRSISSNFPLKQSLFFPSNDIYQQKRFHNSHQAVDGIPKLFRWLIDLYPIVLESVNEGLSSRNAMTIDNFYLDMNGYILSFHYIYELLITIFVHLALYMLARIPIAIN